MKVCNDIQLIWSSGGIIEYYLQISVWPFVPCFALMWGCCLTGALPGEASAWFNYIPRLVWDWDSAGLRWCREYMYCTIQCGRSHSVTRFHKSWLLTSSEVYSLARLCRWRDFLGLSLGVPPTFMLRKQDRRFAQWLSSFETLAGAHLCTSNWTPAKFAESLRMCRDLSPLRPHTAYRSLCTRGYESVQWVNHRES